VNGYAGMIIGLSGRKRTVIYFETYSFRYWKLLVCSSGEWLGGLILTFNARKYFNQDMIVFKFEKIKKQKVFYHLMLIKQNNIKLKKFNRNAF